MKLQPLHPEAEDIIALEETETGMVVLERPVGE